MANLKNKVASMVIKAGNKIPTVGQASQSVLDEIKKRKPLAEKVANTTKRVIEIGSGIKPMTPDEAGKIREELTKPRQSLADKIVKGAVSKGVVSQQSVDDINQQMSQNKWFKKSDPLYKRIEDKLRQRGVIK